MLDMVFALVLDMTKTASIVIVVVIMARLLLKRAPKVISYALWAVVLFRLLCPFSLEAPVSIIPSMKSVSAAHALSEEPISVLDTGYQVAGDAWNGGSGVLHIQTMERNEYGGTEYTTSAWWEVGQYIWLAGILCMLIYSAVSYGKLRRRLTGAVPLRDNIYLTDHITSPFVMGIFRAKIYLPSSLWNEEREYIILHEQHHIRRLDHIVKLIAFIALCIHWFNPLVWAAFILSCKDMEMSCDEAVVKKFGGSIRADYSASLLRLATGRHIFAGTPLAFGESDPGGRIKNLAKWKKPALWIVVAAVAMAVLVAVVCGTNPKTSLKIKNLGDGVQLTCNLKEPIRSWAIYEDIYLEGELISSAPFIMNDFQEYYDPSARRFTAQLTCAPVWGEEGFGGTLQIFWDNSINKSLEKIECPRDLPKDRYTAFAFLPAAEEWNTDHLDNVVLFRVLLSSQSKIYTNWESNDTTVAYRLVTSAEGLDSFVSRNAEE